MVLSLLVSFFCCNFSRCGDKDERFLRFADGERVAKGIISLGHHTN